jgi:glycosyltransferase involved in cell wall biosynthesis
LPNGVDVTRLSHFSRRFAEKENTILHVGRIGAFQKGSEVILEAFARVSADFPEWRLLLIGPFETAFVRYFEELLQRNASVRGKIVYVGPINTNRERLYEHYSKAKILAFPSRWESFGFVILEAACLGDAILGTKIPSVCDVTRDGEFGYMCPVDDVDCFTETLRYALSNQDDLQQKSESIAKFIAANFDWKGICGTLHQDILKNTAC